jgi:hypothetical protein
MSNFVAFALHWTYIGCSTSIHVFCICQEMHVNNLVHAMHVIEAGNLCEFDVC